jgi:hypothetical protein
VAGLQCQDLVVKRMSAHLINQLSQQHLRAALVTLRWGTCQWRPTYSVLYSAKRCLTQVVLCCAVLCCAVLHLQRIGLKVLRVWGFNDAFPYAPGKYNDKQGQGLDYVIAGAAQRGLRVELALANFWPGESPGWCCLGMLLLLR